MRVDTFEELLPRYVRARQKIRNQRNELRALNKRIMFEQVDRGRLYNEIDRFRRMWDEERKRKLIPVEQKRGFPWLTATIVVLLIIISFELGRLVGA